MTASSAGSVLGGTSGGGGGGSSSPSQPTPSSPTTPAPSVSISLSSSQVEVGEEITVTYSSSNASSCEAKGSLSSIDNLSGTQTFSSWDVGTYFFELTCSGDGGSTTESKSLEVIETFPLGINNRGSDIQLNYNSYYINPKVAINGSGRIIAFCMDRAPDSRIYEWDKDKWLQKGANLNEACTDIHLSDDGSTIAVSNAPGRGIVKIFEWDGVEWAQKGSDLIGEGNNDDFGHEVALSQDGNSIVIGAIDGCNNGCRSGQVYVYEWNGSAWIQKGITINAERDDDRFGTSVDISDDGTVIVAGATGNDNSGGTNAGHTRVFEWRNESWIQKGSDIDGNQGNGQMGYQTRISADGNSVAVSSSQGTNTNGVVKIYSWDGATWNDGISIIGDPVDGERNGERLGFSLDVDKEFNIIAAGAIWNGKNSYRGGSVEFYQNGDPTQAGAAYGSSSETQLGTDVAINRAGDIAIMSGNDLVRVVTLRF